MGAGEGGKVDADSDTGPRSSRPRCWRRSTSCARAAAPASRPMPRGSASRNRCRSERRSGTMRLRGGRRVYSTKSTHGSSSPWILRVGNIGHCCGPWDPVVRFSSRSSFYCILFVGESVGKQSLVMYTMCGAGEGSSLEHGIISGPAV